MNNKIRLGIQLYKILGCKSDWCVSVSESATGQEVRHYTQISVCRQAVKEKIMAKHNTQIKITVCQYRDSASRDKQLSLNPGGRL